MDAVVGRIAESIALRPREVTLIALRGDAEEVYGGGGLAALFAAHGFLPVERVRQLVVYRNRPTSSD